MHYAHMPYALMSARAAFEALRREAAAHRVLRNRARLEELQQVVRTASLIAGAAELEAAERMVPHDSAGRLAVDVQVAGTKRPSRLLDVARVARVDAAGQRVLGVERQLQRRVEALEVEHA